MTLDNREPMIMITIYPDVEAVVPRGITPFVECR